MRAARVHAWGADPTVEDAPDAQPADGESLVAVAAASIAHIDLTVASGNFPHRPPLPYVPGTEGAGTVLRSARFAEGTLVRIRGAGVGLWRDGTCSQLASVPDEALTELPPDAEPELAAAFFSPCVTAYAALHEVGELQSGERVAITGAGGAVGGVAAQLAARAGANVVAVTRDASRARAASLGATVVEIAEGDDVAAAVAAGDPPGVDLLIDTVGGDHLPALVTRAVRPGGRAVLVGYAGGEEVTFDLPNLMAADVRLLPMNLIRRGAGLERVAEELLAAVTSGELELPRTVFALGDIGDALERVRRGTATGRVVLRIP